MVLCEMRHAVVSAASYVRRVVRTRSGPILTDRADRHGQQVAGFESAGPPGACWAARSRIRSGAGRRRPIGIAGLLVPEMESLGVAVGIRREARLGFVEALRVRDGLCDGLRVPHQYHVAKRWYFGRRVDDDDEGGD